MNGGAVQRLPDRVDTRRKLVLGVIGSEGVIAQAVIDGQRVGDIPLVLHIQAVAIAMLAAIVGDGHGSGRSLAGLGGIQTQWVRIGIGDSIGIRAARRRRQHQRRGFRQRIVGLIDRTETHRVSVPAVPGRFRLQPIGSIALVGFL